MIERSELETWTWILKYWVIIFPVLFIVGLVLLGYVPLLVSERRTRGGLYQSVLNQHPPYSGRFE